MPRALRVEADGGSRGNPGVAGYGAIVRDADGRLLAERAAPLGKASNNVAEYRGLIAGLAAAAEIDPGADVVAAMDSKLVVEQMSGRWKIKHEDMRRLALEARELAAAFVAAGGSVHYQWIPRASNSVADKLSNDGMDGLHVCRNHPDSESLGESAEGAATAGESVGVQSMDAESMGEAGMAEEGRDAAQADAEAGDPAAISPRAGRAAQSATGTGAQPGGVAAYPSRGRGEPTRIVLVRHGVTEFTQSQRLAGRGGADPGLTAAGRAQGERAAYLIGELLAGAPARLVTSSLARAVQTGAIIADALGVPAVADPAWDEQNFGDWDGAAMPELIRDKPAEVAALRTDAAYRRPGGESHSDLTTRVWAAYQDVVAAGGTTVVVCHRKPILVVLAGILGLEMEPVWRMAAAPGSLTGIEAWPDGAATLAFTNRT